ncbi:terpineol synthase, chloroplastic-like [Salvia hispanica]|uniref:terpineol synthase, chloroplastic-like n=1 Tax=Salvia hispanica TaxID=49212 RepID=UPI0020094178|nr:terpineol synthase, chloroplastic-like [Salvia hispanica]
MVNLSMHISLPIPHKPAHTTFHGGATTTLYTRPRSSSTRCNAMPSAQTTTVPVPTRRSANYKPSFWDFNYIQSLTTQYTEERHSKRVAELIARAKMLLLHQEMEGDRRLELIDDLQRLAISHHFEQEITQILSSIYHDDTTERDLYSTSLQFRLLREHGFRVSQDVFDCFKNENGDFKTSLCDDKRGMLQLYEASFLLTHGEETLELANVFATKHLQKIGDEGDDDHNLLEMVRYALDLPIHWRTQRPNARWFIEAYGRRSEMNPTILELAKLEFNITQSMHQQELKLISRWWKQTRLSEKLPFARDRIVECYLWTLVGGLSQPQYGYSRIMATKANILITLIDDIFDVYATLDELHLFNDVIHRWDLEAVNQLPNYMQICFLTLNNFINEMACDVLKEQDILIIKYLRKSWQDLCKSFMQEAQWHAQGYTPTLDKYINNGWISSSVPVILSHAFFLVTTPIQKTTVDSLYQYHDLVRCPAVILRLANDLATSPNEMERGDVAESIQCYMKESGASVEEAREHARFLIWNSWKRMNEERVGDSHFSKEFIKKAVDLGRMAQYMYQLGDGHGIQNTHIKERISSLFFKSIV